MLSDKAFLKDISKRLAKRAEDIKDKEIKAGLEEDAKAIEALSKKGIKHNVLNARFHEQEANIVAEAGVPGAVTIATNMAGRGTDIQTWRQLGQSRCASFGRRKQQVHGRQTSRKVWTGN